MWILKKKSKSHEPPSQNIMWTPPNLSSHMTPQYKSHVNQEVVELSHDFSSPALPISQLRLIKCGCAAGVSYYVCLITPFHQRSSLSRMAKPPKATSLTGCFLWWIKSAKQTYIVILCSRTNPTLWAKRTLAFPLNTKFPILIVNFS